MIIKMLPYLLILFGVVGFFVTADNLGPNPQNVNVIQNLALLVVSLPWWGKLLSILIGLGWVVGSKKKNI
jgi:hypothetical protein